MSPVDRLVDRICAQRSNSVQTTSTDEGALSEKKARYRDALIIASTIALTIYLFLLHQKVKGRGLALHPAHRLGEYNTIPLDTKIVYLH